MTALLGQLSGNDANVRSSAAAALGSLGNGTEAVVIALLGKLSDDDASVCRSAVDALSRLGKLSANTTPKVADWIEQNQDSEHVRYGIDVLWTLVIEQA